MSKLTAVLTLAGMIAIAAAAPAAAEEVRSFNQHFEADSLDELYVDFPVGELSVEGSSSERIMVEVKIECSRRRSLDACMDRAEDITLQSRRGSDRLDLTVEGYSKWRSRGMHLEMKVLVPRDLDVRLDMSIGELTIRKLLGSVTVDMGIGEVSLDGMEEPVGHVNLDTGIGEATLSTHRGRSSSSGLFTREISWTEGNGDSDIRIDLGIGEISVTLR